MRWLWPPDMDWVGDRRAVNIAVIGDVCHGKTTLVASLVRGQHERLEVPLPLEPPPNYTNPIQLALRGRYLTSGFGTLVPTATARRVLNLIDCPAGPSNLTDAIRLVGMADGVILVVSAEAGVTANTRGMAYAASRAGVRHLVGFVNLHTEAEPASLWWNGNTPAYTTRAERVDEVETELRRLLLDAGFPGDDVAVVRGGTWSYLHTPRSPRDWVDEMLFAIETELAIPPREEEAPLLLLASGEDYIGTTSGPANEYLDHAVQGAVRRGVLRQGAAVEFVGGRATGEVAKVFAIRSGNRTLTEALPGDFVSVVFRSGGPNPRLPCHVLAEPGTCRVARKVVARLTVLTPEQGGRRRGIPSGMCPRISIGTAAFRSPLVMGSPGATLKPGESGVVEIETALLGYTNGPRGIVCEPGQGFVCRDGGRVIAVGEVEAME